MTTSNKYLFFPSDICAEDDPLIVDKEEDIKNAVSEYIRLSQPQRHKTAKAIFYQKPASMRTMHSRL